MGELFHDLRCRYDVPALIGLIDELRLGRLGDERWTEGRFRCPFPWHPDPTPTALYFPADGIRGPQPAGHGRWWCPRCGDGGDATALVKVALGLASQRAAAERLRDGFGDLPPRPAVTAPLPPARQHTTTRTINPDLVRLARQEKASAASLVAAFFADRISYADDRPDAQWAVNTFRLGALPSDLLWLPYWRVRHAGGKKGLVAVSVKYRQRGDAGEWSKKHRGPQTGHFFGEHLDADQPFAVVCEGESDAIAVAWWLRDKTNVLILGVPGTGAPLTEAMGARLADRRVVLLPDADAAGKQWAQGWSVGVRQASAASVAVAVLPPGQDACSAGRTALRTALRKAVHPSNRRERRAHLQ